MKDIVRRLYIKEKPLPNEGLRQSASVVGFPAHSERCLKEKWQKHTREHSGAFQIGTARRLTYKAVKAKPSTRVADRKDRSLPFYILTTHYSLPLSK